ncbi:MAG: LytTR family DNA-binding domain-containing protein [Ferruginibacter sp.]
MFLKAERKSIFRSASIVYISSSTPYISIHAGNKKFLSNETLKSVEEKLPPDQFIRIHKSTIVNINMVTSFQSRLNGDYDLCFTG